MTVEMSHNMKIKVLCLVKGREHFFEPVKASDKFDLIFEELWQPESIEKAKPSLVVSVGESYFEIWNCYKKAAELGIPTLTVLDGIPEWRDIWENPRYGFGGGQLNRQLFQADKVACHGNYHAWLFQRWGLGLKAEVVGMPWLDKYFQLKKSDERCGGKKNLLVMTANTPGFTQDQVEKTETALKDLSKYLSSDPSWNPVWRLRGGLCEKLGLQSPEYGATSLFDMLKITDAVVTTPSTAMIEAMLAGIPTAIVDYTDSPSYVGAAWKITHGSQIEKAMKEMASPPRNKMLFQDDILHGYLECDTPAAPRLVELMEKMADIGEKAKAEGNMPVFNETIIKPSFPCAVVPSGYFDLKELYPGHPVYANADINSLRQEMVNLREEVSSQRAELKKRSFGFWLKVATDKIRGK